LWAVDLAYDHPARDLAEYIRSRLLNRETEKEMAQFLQDYQKRRPLSVFGWRLLYARLLFPVHIFDLVGRGFLLNDPSGLYGELTVLLASQRDYEAKLCPLFNMASIDPQLLHSPMLHSL